MIEDHSSRRAFCAGAATAAAAATIARAQGDDHIAIIDTHFHLYDQTRPQGAPYPFTPNAPPFLPRDFRATATALGIVGDIKWRPAPGSKIISGC